MSNGGSGTRPGGLTALAVINFVLGGIGTILMLLAFAAIGHAEQQTGAVSEATRNDPNAWLGWLSLLLMLATAVLLIVSGVGYLGQKRFLGRAMGNAYVAASLASSAIGIVTGGFTLFSIIFLVYPILTLLLINGTFKDDLVH